MKKHGKIGFGKCSQCGALDYQCGCPLEIVSSPKKKIDKDIKKLVLARLETMSDDLVVSIG